MGIGVEMNGLDLFSGIGGLTLALSQWVKPIAYCENNTYAQAVLLSRMQKLELPVAPIWDDITTLVPNVLPRNGVDIISAGFPCQDISVAGHGIGLDGKRSGLFFEIVRLIGELRPRFIFLENVPAITVRGLDRVLLELTALGYDCRWTIVSAAEVGAVHIRERWFLLAHPNSVRLRKECGSEVRWDHAERSRSMEPHGASSSGRTTRTPEGLTQPRVDRTGDGLSARVDRHHGLGNAVVPLQARTAFMKLMGIDYL